MDEDYLTETICQKLKVNKIEPMSKSKSSMKTLSSNCDCTLRCNVFFFYLEFPFVYRNVTALKEQWNHCDTYEDKLFKYKFITIQVHN